MAKNSRIWSTDDEIEFFKRYCQNNKQRCEKYIELFQNRAEYGRIDPKKVLDFAKKTLDTINNGRPE